MKKKVNKKKKILKQKIKNILVTILSDKILSILALLLIIITIILMVFWVSKGNDLNTESKMVSELHNYFSSDDLGNCEGLFTYADKKIEYKDIDSETRICLAYQKSNIKKVETEKLKADKKKNTCTKDNMVFRVQEDTNECLINKIEKSTIDDTYKKLYGKNIENNESFKIDNLNICYLKGDYYYCGLSETYTYTLGSESIIYRVIKKAEEKGSKIVLYDYFVKINENTCFKNYTTSTINQDCTDRYSKKKKVNYNFMKKYGTEYKHVFKKTNDDSYHWVSSEPIK